MHTLRRSTCQYTMIPGPEARPRSPRRVPGAIRTVRRSAAAWASGVRPGIARPPACVWRSDGDASGGASLASPRAQTTARAALQTDGRGPGALARGDRRRRTLLRRRRGGWRRASTAWRWLAAGDSDDAPRQSREFREAYTRIRAEVEITVVAAVIKDAAGGAVVREVTRTGRDGRAEQETQYAPPNGRVGLEYLARCTRTAGRGARRWSSRARTVARSRWSTSLP